MKRLDWYIVKKFLGTFFFSIVLILSIAIVFDLTEKMDDFFEEQIPLREIILDYYIPFIPYYMNMFSSLFIFISVIFFTSLRDGAVYLKFFSRRLGHSAQQRTDAAFYGQVYRAFHNRERA